MEFHDRRNEGRRNAPTDATHVPHPPGFDPETGHQWPAGRHTWAVGSGGASTSEEVTGWPWPRGNRTWTVNPEGVAR